MNKINKKTLLLNTLLASTLAISSIVLAETTEETSKKTTETNSMKSEKTTKEKQVDKEQSIVNQKAIKDHAKSQKDLLKKIDKGIAEGFESVDKATKLIKQNKNKEAIKALQEATGKFDIALGVKPDLGLMPINATVKVHQLLSSSALIKKDIALASDLLKTFKIQAAREVLLPLRDDIESHTVFLPMNTYPDAIKLATKMLVEGNKKAALETLATAFSTLINETSITPLSLIRVAAIMKTASELDKEKNKDNALILIGVAEDQLAIATALGYTNANSDLYQDLSTQLTALKKEITGGNVVERLYKKLRESVTELLTKQDESKKNEVTKEKEESKAITEKQQEDPKEKRENESKK